MSVNPKKQVVLIVASSALAGFSLASIIDFTDPTTASWLTFSFLYLSLFIFSLGVTTLVGLGLRKLLRQGLYIINLRGSFRQGLLISILIVSSFVLLSKQLLFWWVELSLIIFLAALEAFLNLKI